MCIRDRFSPCEGTWALQSSGGTIAVSYTHLDVYKRQNQVSGVVLGAGERTTPTDNSVSGVNYRKKSRGGENTRNSIHQLTEEHRVPAGHQTTNKDDRVVNNNKI